MSEDGAKDLSPAQRKLARSVPDLPEDRVAWHLRQKPWARHLASDLSGAAHLAVEEAARTFSAKHGTAFSTWARSVVDWAILSAIRKEAEHQQLREATSVVLQWGTLAFTPAEDDKLRADRDDESTADQKLRSVLKAKVISAALALAAQEEEASAERLDPEQVAARRPLATAMRTLRASLPPRHQQLLACVYDRRMKLAEAAAELGLAYPTVKVLHAKILRDLHDQLVHLGFTGLG